MGKIDCQLVAIDLDGTLLDKEHQLSEGNRKAVMELAESGVIVVLASGRMYATILPFAQMMRLESPIISYNGAMVKDMKTGELVCHTPIPSSIAKEIIEYCVQRGLHLNFYNNDVLYVRELNRWSKLYDTRTGATSHLVGDMRFFDGKKPTKLQIVDAPENIDSLFTEFCNWLQDRLYITKTQPEYLEFMNPKVSKGRALTEAANKLGIPRENIVAFGDGYNDVSLMEAAGFSIAMGNSVNEILACASYVTDTNEENGVATAIRKLLLRN